MSQIINELATIEISNEVLQNLDIGNIYRNFNNNYRRLDDLKNFRTDYEKQNFLKRYWHSDKLRDAQLDSAEVQAEYAKTIGQLMLLSVLQSKKLSEQQNVLNEQQDKLKSQADGIAKQAGELQSQHRALAEQSAKLETLVHEYFELKGLTEDGAQKLISIAMEVKATKDGMLQDFNKRAKNVEMLCGEVIKQMESVSAHVNAQLNENSEQTRSIIQAAQINSQHELDAFATKLAEHDAVYNEKMQLLDGRLVTQSMRVTEVDKVLSDQKTGLAACIEQQKAYPVKHELFEKKISDRLNRLSIVVAFSSVITPIILFGLARLMKWI